MHPVRPAQFRPAFHIARRSSRTKVEAMIRIATTIACSALAVLFIAADLRPPAQGGIRPAGGDPSSASTDAPALVISSNDQRTGDHGDAVQADDAETHPPERLGALGDRGRDVIGRDGSTLRLRHRWGR